MIARTLSNPMTKIATAAFALALAILTCGPAAAETYTVELGNGEEFESFYAPQEASWDDELVLLLSEGGNWIGIPRAEIESITIATEFEGRGQLVNPTTIFMGLSANDQPGPVEGGQANEVDRLIQALQDSSQPQQSYSTEQFVEPDAVGSGIPVGFTQQGTPQLTPPTGGGRTVVPVPVPSGGEGGGVQ